MNKQVAIRHATSINDALRNILIAIYRRPGPRRLPRLARRPCAGSEVAPRFSPGHAPVASLSSPLEGVVKMDYV